MKRILKDPPPEDKIDGRSFNIRSRKKMEREVRRLTYTSARAAKTKGLRSKKGKKFGLYTAEDMGIDEDESNDEAAQQPSADDTKKPEATEDVKPAATEATEQPEPGSVNEKGEEEAERDTNQNA